MSGTVELRKYLETIGCESYLETLTENGFYTTKAALASATYEELLDCNVRPVHAKLILSSLRASGGPSVPAADDGPEVVANFLRSVGLEHTQDALKAAGYTSMARLGESSYEELVAANLKPVHARLIVSNLDSQSTAAAATPQRSVGGVDDEVLGSRTALLGGARAAAAQQGLGGESGALPRVPHRRAARGLGRAQRAAAAGRKTPPMLRAPHKKSGGATSCPPARRTRRAARARRRAPRKATARRHRCLEARNNNITSKRTTMSCRSIVTAADASSATSRAGEDHGPKRS